MSRIGIISMSPLSDVEAKLVEFADNARKAGAQIQSVYIAGIYKNSDGTLDMVSSYQNCLIPQLSMVMGMVQTDMFEQMVNSGEFELPEKIATALKRQVEAADDDEDSDDEDE
jgi:hypothetical protein